MPMLLTCVLFSFLSVAEAGRVEIHESVLDAAATDGSMGDVVDAEGNATGFLKPKLKVADVKEAEKKFRGGDFPILVDGEVVEMAFNNGQGLGKNDWLLFTNWRMIHCDAKMIFKKINKWEYTSRLWHAYHSATASTAGKFDNDCEIKLSPFGPQYEFAKDLSGEKLFEILEYVNKKLQATYDQRKSLLKAGDKLLAQHWWNGDVPQLKARSVPLDKSVEEILGPAAGIIEKNEKVLYKFTESMKRGRKDELIVTDKKVVKVDKKFSKSRLSYKTYPYPPGGSLFKFIHMWKVETAGSGMDFDCELSATAYFDYREPSILMVPNGNTEVPVALPGPWETIKIDFDKRHVNDKQLFEYHTTLQTNIAKELGFKR